MKQNNKKTKKFQSKKIQTSFTSKKLTQYAGLSPLMKRISADGIPSDFDKLFPTTIITNATKFSTTQILLSILLASLSGVNRLSRIANFTKDILVRILLNVKSSGISDDSISLRLKNLGQQGAHRLHEYILSHNQKYLQRKRLDRITLDCDSTVSTVFGCQEGAAKGFNSHKKGAKSYHSLLGFVSECKIVLNTWFRTGSSYTSNGIVEFLKQTKVYIPTAVSTVFFRADSGFFSGELFDLLEEYQWEYLVKVKIKNLTTLLKSQTWELVSPEKGISICEFTYQSKSWKKKRTLRAIRTIKEYEYQEFFGKSIEVPVYEYACYCSNLEGTAIDLHENYKKRSISETWIEQIKNHLRGCKTLTNNFHSNDILWQLALFAYNLSVIFREVKKEYWRQEHRTFKEFFITLPALVTAGARQTRLLLYEHYYDKVKWEEFKNLLAS